MISTVAIALAIPTSYMGYLAFGDQVLSVVIYNLPPNDVMSILAKSFYVFTVMGSYVIVIQPIFYIIEESSLYKKLLDLKEESYSFMQWVQYCGTRTALVVLILFFSFIVPNINILLQVSGSISGTIITVIMPVVFYNRAYSDTEKN